LSHNGLYVSFRQPLLRSNDDYKIGIFEYERRPGAVGKVILRKVVSVSLGSSKRDHAVDVELLGEDFNIKRVGADGDFARARQLLQEYDGRVDAIGLGGIDIYLYSPTRRYEIVDGIKLRDTVKKTPVVDGSGLKNSLEPMAVRWLGKQPGFNLPNMSVLMVSAVDRFGMAKAFSDAGAKTVFGDLIFALGVKVPVYTMDKLAQLADELLPKIVKTPFDKLYPIGAEQDAEPDPKFSEFYDQADIIAGDFHYIRRYMPADLSGKTIVTNTVTARDVDELKKRNVLYLLTTTPEYTGRSFGTNVLEAAFLVLLDKDWAYITNEDYLNLLEKLDYQPILRRL
jgi:hypothetical protein